MKPRKCHSAFRPGLDEPALQAEDRDLTQNTILIWDKP